MDEGVSTWVVLLVGLLGGAVGAAVTTWWRARHERIERQRERMIEAAAEFLEAANAYMARANAAIKELLGQYIISAAADPVVQDARHAGNAAIERLHVVWLVFGPTSNAGAAASIMMESYARVQHQLEASPPDAVKADEELQTASTQLEFFVLAAHNHAEQGRVMRRQRRLQSRRSVFRGVQTLWATGREKELRADD